MKQAILAGFRERPTRPTCRQATMKDWPAATNNMVMLVATAIVESTRGSNGGRIDLRPAT